MFSFLKKAFGKDDLRQRILFTLGVLFVFRLGSAITIPGIDSEALTGTSGTYSIITIMNMLAGGSLERFSLFSLGVSPYITSSIIIELLSMDVIPILTEWTQEGEVGRKKKDRTTRFLTAALGALQAFSLTYAFDKSYDILTADGVVNYLFVVLIMVAGSMLCLWLGDQITNKGIGNGISLLIFTGIVANAPSVFISVFEILVLGEEGTAAMAMGGLKYALFIVLFLIIVVFVVFMEGSMRKLKVVYASNSNPMMSTKDEQYFPIKVNSAGVIPVIFASSLLSTPLTIASLVGSGTVTEYITKICTYNDPQTYPIGFILYLVLIVLFSFFYSNLQVDANKINNQLADNLGHIPGYRIWKRDLKNPNHQKLEPSDTELLIKRTLNRLTVIGALFLVIIASIPILIPVIWPEIGSTSVSIFGTGMIIVTGVALETVNQIRSKIERRRRETLSRNRLIRR